MSSSGSPSSDTRDMSVATCSCGFLDRERKPRCFCSTTLGTPCLIARNLPGRAYFVLLFSPWALFLVLYNWAFFLRCFRFFSLFSLFFHLEPSQQCRVIEVQQPRELNARKTAPHSVGGAITLMLTSSVLLCRVVTAWLIVCSLSNDELSDFLCTFLSSCFLLMKLANVFVCFVCFLTDKFFVLLRKTSPHQPLVEFHIWRQ